MPSARRSSNGRATACRRIRAPGSCPAGRFKAIDGIRRHARFDSMEDVAGAGRGASPTTPPPWDARGIEDDRLRLIFTCCHPALAPDAQVALTLREVCGLTTEEIAQAFLSAAPTLAQRIVRAKAKIRDARIPYQVPAPDELPERLDSVLRVVYLVFNEGYSASSGPVADARRSVRRGDPARTAAGRAAAGARGDRVAGADAAAGIAARRAHLADGRAGPAERPGPLALEPRADRGRVGAGGTSARVAALRSLHAQAAIAAVHAERGRAPTPRTGTRSSASTTSCCAPIRRRWSS